MRDTIFALATASGRAAVAVLRVSGPEAGSILQQLCRRVLKPREATLTKITGAGGEVIDQGLALWFPAPRSFTGEDVFELQLHGGRAIIDGASKALADLGARPAEPGEFTRRAFEAGRLDLTQAEAVADLVDAETEAQRRQALRQLDGEFSHTVERWRAVLINALANLSAKIDFPDEDVPDEIEAHTRAAIESLIEELNNALGSMQGERIRDGFKIALIGAPNAGKSSLLNGLIQRDAAIITDIPGTTRDVIEAPLLIGGYKVLLADTAGLRKAEDAVEIEGVRRARVWAAQADLRVIVVDPMLSPNIDCSASLLKDGDVLVFTKTDLSSVQPRVWLERARAVNLAIALSSTVHPDGLLQLMNAIETVVTRSLDTVAPPLITRERHRRMLSDAIERLSTSLNSSRSELLAEHLRLAAEALAGITGRVGPEDVLDRVFSSFCIGK